MAFFGPTARGVNLIERAAAVAARNRIISRTANETAAAAMAAVARISLTPAAVAAAAAAAVAAKCANKTTVSANLSDGGGGCGTLSLGL